MANEIQYSSITTGHDTTNGYYIKGILQFTYDPKWKFKEHSLRVYYRPISQSPPASYIDIVKPGTSPLPSGCVEAIVWQEPYQQFSQSFAAKIVKKAIGLDISRYIVKFIIPNLTPGTTYATTAWLRLYNSRDVVKRTVRSPYDNDNEGIHFTVTTEAYNESRPLFRVAKYSQDTVDGYSIDWEDFTDCIKLPSYEVNSEDVNEDWDDSDYRTHRIVTRKKINGKFEMIFPSIERQKRFLYLLEQSRQLNGEGEAYVDLEVMVNNVLDTGELVYNISMGNVPCISYIGKFFIKIDNNAWVQPIFGQYDKYNPWNVTIQEA